MKNSAVLLILFLSGTLIQVSGQTLFVKTGGNGDGSSWNEAQGDLRAVLEGAAPGTQVWVAKGVYYPVSCMECLDEDRTLSFVIPDEVALFGGFAGNETSIDQRDLTTNTSVLSGDIDQDGTENNNSYTVVYTKNVTSSTIVDGFTITAGNADLISGLPGTPKTSGGGWFNDGQLDGFSAHPIIRNCLFFNNKAVVFGGGMYNDGSFSGSASPIFENCIFRENEALIDGGALYSYGVFSGSLHSKLIGCRFLSNKAGNSGGALYVNTAEDGVGDLLLQNCLFSGNEAINNGGALYNFAKGGSNNTAYLDCTFEGNNAGFLGGGVYNDGSFSGACNGRFVDCNIINNSSGNDGGGVYNKSFNNGVSSPYFENCNFSFNHSGFAGGALFNSGVEGKSNPNLISCTFSQNRADTYGGAIYNHGTLGESNPGLTNCVFYKNRANSAGAIYCLGSERGNSSPVITNCTFYGNTAEKGGAIYSNASDSTGNSSPIVTNCILYHNKADLGNDFRIVAGHPIVRHSLVDAKNCEELFNGESGGITCDEGLLFNQDPLFVDTVAGNLRLQANSPVIDKGDNAAIFAAGVDIDRDGSLRNQNERVDLGAYEFDSGQSTPTAQISEEKRVRIFPNPSAGQITISFTDFENEVKLLLLTMEGKIIFENALKPLGKSYTQSFDWSALPRGVYFLRLMNRKQLFIKKIMLQ